MLSITLLVSVLCAFKAGAVNIIHYPTEDCKGDQLLTCPDFPEGTDKCCQVPMEQAFEDRSVLFQGLPLPTGQGIYYKAQDTATNYCDRACNAGYGFNLCLSCDIMMANIVTAGANWLNVPMKEKRGESAGNSTCTPIYPSIYTVDNHHFNIGKEAGVPQEDTDTFLALWRSGQGIKYEHLPPHLLRHENLTFVPESD